MIRFYGNAIEAAGTRHRARRALVWQCVAQQHQLAVLRRSGTRRPRFSAHRSAVLGVHVVLVAGLARRAESHSTRNSPELASSGYRCDLEISITWSLARWTPADRPRDPPTDPRDGSRNFLWGAPRIHGELLKIGITVSQATVSRYMPPSPKDRRSQAWRTFIRNHATSGVQSHGFNAHSCTRDLLSQIWSRSRAFTYHLSAFVVALVTGPSCLVSRTVHPLLVGVARPRVQFTRIVTLTNNSMTLACRYRLATGKVSLLTIDRIRDPPTTQELKRLADRSSRCSTGGRVSSRSTRRYTTASSTNGQYSPNCNCRASRCHRRPTSSSHISNYVFEGFMRGSRFEEPQATRLHHARGHDPASSMRLFGPGE
jgi:hypothetical protein